MAELFTNGGFETDSDWTLGPWGDAANEIITSDDGNQRSGVGYLKLRAFKDPPIGGSWKQGSAGQTVAVTADTAHTLVLWVDATSAGQGELRVLIDDVEIASLVRSDHSTQPGGTLGTGYVEVSLEFTPTTSSIEVQLSSEENPSGGTFWIDDASLTEVASAEVDVAVLLHESAVSGVMAVLQADLATQLTEIETERADSLTLTAPDTSSWNDARTPEFVANAVQIDVWDDDGGFPRADRDASTWQAGATRQITVSTRITIRLTHVNHDGVSISKMANRSRRYLAALARVLRDNPTLTVSAVDYVSHLRFLRTETTSREIVGDDDTRRADTVLFQIEAIHNQVDTNEGTSGAPAAYTVRG